MGLTGKVNFDVGKKLLANEPRTFFELCCLIQILWMKSAEITKVWEVSTLKQCDPATILKWVDMDIRRSE